MCALDTLSTDFRIISKCKKIGTLSNIPILKKLSSSGNSNQVEEHFETNGFGEGRIPHPNFELAS